MSPLVVKRIWIEKSECLWHTLCVSEAPDLITARDAGGTPAVLPSALLYTKAGLGRLISASGICPVYAFYLETEDGRILNVQESDEVQAALRSGEYRWSSMHAAQLND
jgi:hypothetical protein